MTENFILLIEPFATGSHKHFMDQLARNVPGSELVCMPGKKWQWRARTSGLYLSQQISREHNYRVLFASSVLNMAELVAVRPDLAELRKVLYFHENQLVYPVRKQQDRDFQFGYNQIVSSLVADVVVFNSSYNMTSFLDAIPHFLKLIPDHRPTNIADLIRPKCHVIYFPLNLPSANMDGAGEDTGIQHETAGKDATDKKEFSIDDETLDTGGNVNIERVHVDDRSEDMVTQDKKTDVDVTINNASSGEETLAMCGNVTRQIVHVDDGSEDMVTESEPTDSVVIDKNVSSCEETLDTVVRLNRETVVPDRSSNTQCNTPSMSGTGLVMGSNSGKLPYHPYGSFPEVLPATRTGVLTCHDVQTQNKRLRSDIYVEHSSEHHVIPVCVQEGRDTETNILRSDNHIDDERDTFRSTNIHQIITSELDPDNNMARISGVHSTCLSEIHDIDVSTARRPLHIVWPHRWYVVSMYNDGHGHIY